MDGPQSLAVTVNAAGETGGQNRERPMAPSAVAPACSARTAGSIAAGCLVIICWSWACTATETHGAPLAPCCFLANSSKAQSVLPAPRGHGTRDRPRPCPTCSETTQNHQSESQGCGEAERGRRPSTPAPAQRWAQAEGAAPHECSSSPGTSAFKTLLGHLSQR